MTGTRASPSQQLPEPARIAWTGLRNELEAILGDDLVAMWAYGGTVAVEGPPRPADLDTYVIVRRPIDEPTAEAIEGVQTIIGEHMGVEWDAWYVVEDDARRPDVAASRVPRGSTRHVVGGQSGALARRSLCAPVWS